MTSARLRGSFAGREQMAAETSDSSREGSLEEGGAGSGGKGGGGAVASTDVR
jgi:hypothetical protein